MQVRFRPIDPIDVERLARPGSWNREPFRATWGTTLSLLESELEKVGAHDCVIEAGFREQDLRLDGWPRSGATAEHPCVIVSFESKHGPLRYGTGEFRTWQQNVRAIALGLKALRAVDRYGITRRGEQYAGFKALPAGGPDLAQRGRELIAEHGGVREAQRATHPDHGGDADDFRAVQAAAA